MVRPERNPVGRRTLLRTIAVGSAGVLAGCTSTNDNSDDADETSVDSEPVSVRDQTAWQTTTVTDITTGDKFSIDEFDQPVLVHTFAMTCATCHSQQLEFRDLYDMADTDIEIAELTIDTHVDTDALQEHAADEGFDWQIAVSTGEIIDSLTRDFNRDVVQSASSPVIVVCPDGETYRLEKVIDASALESVIDDVC